ncbi:MAG: hypothetical protein QQN63_03015 [Nitrosopumilus sp.]
MKKNREIFQELKKKAKRAPYISWVAFAASVIVFITDALFSTGLALQGYILLGLAFISVLYSVKLNRRLLKGVLKD